MKKIIFFSVILFAVMYSCKNRAIESVTVLPTTTKEDGSMQLTDSFVKKSKEVDTLSDGSRRLH